MGLVPMERLEKEFDIEVEWKGLEIHPELPPEGLLWEARYSPEQLQQIEGSMHSLAAGVGLTMRLPSLMPNSHLALEAAEFAREAGCLTQFHRRLFEANFQDDINIGEIGRLEALAEEVGLDGKALSQALAGRRYERHLMEATKEAHQLGINGVPTYIVGGRRSVGAQPYEVLRQAIVLAGARPRQPQA
ncbi:MAG: DsbA family protein [Dehalococcoidia bacterium]|nr:DsbA family protein [Dehalococcoidia bacterium]